NGYDFRFNTSVHRPPDGETAVRRTLPRTICRLGAPRRRYGRAAREGRPSLIHAVDWFPTFLTLAGGAPDAGMDGVNQWPTISSGAPSARSEFVYNIDDIDNNAAIRVGQYKLIEGSPGQFNGWTPLPPLTASDMATASFPQYQLFDIEVDPTEHNDIANDHPDVVSKLVNRLNFHKATMVPSNMQAADPASNPDNFGGNWTPGWC
ncbi:ARSI-like protein, partial [Mya arenaria]